MLDILDIPETILQQLWGKKFLAMTWATNLLAWEKKFQFKIPLSNWINSVVIDYNSCKDEYIIKFYKIKWIDFKEVSNFNGIYFDKLVEVFEQETWLKCSL